MIELDADRAAWSVEHHSVLDGTITADLSPRIISLGRSCPANAVPMGLRVHVPEHQGTGTWDILQLAEGLHLIMGRAEYHKRHRWQGGDGNLAKIRILLSGRLISEKQGVDISGVGAFVEVFPSSKSTEFFLDSSKKVRMITLCCTRGFFKSNYQSYLGSIPSPISDLFDDRGTDPGGANHRIGPDVLRAANDLFRNSNRYAPKLRKTYMSLKANEIICAMLQDLSQEQRTPTIRIPFSSRDVGRIHEARDIIQEEFARVLTIDVLSRAVGINQTKLKALFKATFGITVFAYIQQCRMGAAEKMLLGEELPLAEIANRVGYDHCGNFSTAFKKYFGYTPSECRRTGVRRDQ